MGELRVPANALYRAQTQRAVENFPISGKPMRPPFVAALAQIKRACAEANMDLALLNKKIGGGIVAAAKEVAAGGHAGEFPVDVFQTGSGTSSNMNINEVLATLAQRKCKMPVDANDHVNMGQSSNDVIPTAIHVSAVLQLRAALLPALAQFVDVLAKKARATRHHVKTGRTHLMDAMPLRMSQEIEGWMWQMKKARARICDSEKRLLLLAQGGTAVGTGVNTAAGFAKAFARRLSANTGAPFAPNPCFFEGMAAQDAAVEMSGQLRALAVGLMKISNDLRWMNSGPLAGLGEAELPALQPGSSIMPGKVNPVIPEAAAMVAARVMGNDAGVAVAGQSGNFQLNVMLPLIADNLLESIALLANVLPLLAKCVAGFRPRPQRLQASLAQNPILVTALNPVIGYAAAAAIAKKAYAQGRPILDVAAEETTLSPAQLKKLLNPAKLTQGGIDNA